MSSINHSGNRIEMVIDGTIDSEQMESLIAEFIDRSKNLESIQLLYIDHDFKLPTLGALGVKLSHFGGLFKVSRKIQRAALLTNKGWLKKAAAFENIIIPWIEIKTFDANAREQAETWLAEDPKTQ